VTSDGSMDTSASLRPLGVGERIDAGFKAYRSNFWSMVRALVVVVLIASAIESLVLVSMTSNLPTTTTTNGPFGTTTTLSTSGAWSLLAGFLVIGVISWLLTVWASATCIQIVGSSFVGQDVDWRQARRHAARRLGSLLWLALLISLIMAGVGLVLFAPGVLLLIIGGSAVINFLGGVLTAIAWIAFVVFVIWFSTAQVLAVPTLMLEDVRGYSAIRRSVSLIKGTWWSVFGTIVLTEIIIGVVYFGALLVLGIVTLILPNNDTFNFIRTLVQTSATLLIVTPFAATIYAILAIDMRIRKEGFDLELLAQELDTVTVDRRVGPNSGSSTPTFPSLGANTDSGDESTDDPTPPTPDA